MGPRTVVTSKRMLPQMPACDIPVVRLHGAEGLVESQAAAVERALHAHYGIGVADESEKDADPEHFQALLLALKAKGYQLEHEPPTVTDFNLRMGENLPPFAVRDQGTIDFYVVALARAEA